MIFPDEGDYVLYKDGVLKLLDNGRPVVSQILDQCAIKYKAVLHTRIQPLGYTPRSYSFGCHMSQNDGGLLPNKKFEVIDAEAFEKIKAIWALES